MFCSVFHLFPVSDGCCRVSAGFSSFGYCVCLAAFTGSPTAARLRCCMLVTGVRYRRSDSFLFVYRLVCAVGGNFGCTLTPYPERTAAVWRKRWVKRRGSFVFSYPSCRSLSLSLSGVGYDEKHALNSNWFECLIGRAACQSAVTTLVLPALPASPTDPRPRAGRPSDVFRQQVSNLSFSSLTTEHDWSDPDWQLMKLKIIFRNCNNGLNA